MQNAKIERALSENYGAEWDIIKKILMLSNLFSCFFLTVKIYFR